MLLFSILSKQKVLATKKKLKTTLVETEIKVSRDHDRSFNL